MTRFNSGTTVTLTAAPSAGNTFDGWSGAGCSGTGTCQVTLNAAAGVTATFTAPVGNPNQTLTVAKSGTGTGTVTSNPAGIDCGATCSAQFAGGTSVTLTATPACGLDLQRVVRRRLLGHGHLPGLAVRSHDRDGDVRARQHGSGRRRWGGGGGGATRRQPDPHGRQGRHRYGQRHQQPCRDRLRRDVCGADRLRHERHAHGHAGPGLGVRRVVGWRLLRDGRLPGPLTANTTVTATFAQGAAAFQPDGLIALGLKSFAGNNIYNTTGKRQTKAATRKAFTSGKVVSSATYRWTVQNDGTVRDTFVLKATANQVAGITVKYVIGTRNVTRAVKAGTQTIALNAGKSTTIKVTVKVLPKATIGKVSQLLLKATSKADKTKSDTVRANTTVR